MDAPEVDSPSIAVFTATDPNGVRTLHVSGEVDLSTCTVLQEALKRSIADYTSELFIDLTEVNFMDSSGLHALMDAARALRSRGGFVSLRNPGHTVYRMLELSGLLTYFHIAK